MSDQIKEQLGYIRAFEEKLGLSPGFFERLLHEDDWSFLIKLHALVEAASTMLLTEALNKPELADHFSRVPLSDSEQGKLSIMKALGVVDIRYRRFIRKLSELRNSAVHNIKYTNINFKNMVTEARIENRNALADALGAGVRSVEGRRELLQENPKGLIWVSALCLISIMALHKIRFESDNRISQLGIEALSVIGESSE
jgi:hypothetical protein